MKSASLLSGAQCVHMLLYAPIGLLYSPINSEMGPLHFRSVAEVLFHLFLSFGK